jgi:ABC-2 type transport system permease protein
VALLIAYPIVIATLIGFALSRGPEKPEVALYNAIPPSNDELRLGGQRIRLSDQVDELFKAIDLKPAHSRAEAIRKVKDGDVLGALVVPEDLTRKLETGGFEPGTVEVFYNAEDPAKQRFVESTIKGEVQSANAALTKLIAREALRLLSLIDRGGTYRFLGRDFDVLGLERSERILRRAESRLPRGSPLRREVEDVIGFSQLARQNLSFSDEVLGVVGQPIRVKSHVIKGGSTSLTSFAVAIAVAVSLMFITLLLAAGALALEREENVFPRLVRGLVSRTALLAEKGLLASGCSLVVALLMLGFLSLFVDLDWSRFPLWLLGIAAGGLAFSAMGLALGALAREVRAASLLAFMLSLPIAFLALVPSGAVSAGLYDVVRVISAAFPFKPTLDALNSALNASGGMGLPLLHLGILVLAFGALSRVALRRFA